MVLLRVFSLSMLLVFMVFSFSPANANTFNYSTILDTSSPSYSPIIESDRWAQLDGRNERVAACQIPDMIQNNLSTENLLDLALDYPFMIELFAFDTYREGFLRMYKEYSVLEELTKRDDFGVAVIKKYSDIPVAEENKVFDGKESIMKLAYLEILLAQPEIVGNLNKQEIKAIYDLASLKNIEKMNAPTIYGGCSDTFHDAVDEVSMDSSSAAMQVADVMIELTPDNSTTSLLTTVKTPKGTSVSVTNNAGIADWTTSQMASIRKQYEDAFPQILFLLYSLYIFYLLHIHTLSLIC
jgi:hypothetical protein